MVTVISKSLQRHLLICSIVVFFTITPLLVWLNNHHNAPVLVLIGVSGAFGGLVNIYWRAALILPAKEDTKVVELAAFHIYTSPIIGAILAVVLYMVFLGGLVSGVLFPHFSHGSEELVSPKRFMRIMALATNSDLAKAIIWSFIAGFYQHFVLTLLSRVVPRGDKGDENLA